MKRIVLDTNVIISAILFGGPPRKVFESVLSCKYRAYISRELLDEIESVLSRPKFALSREIIQSIIRELQDLFEPVSPQESLKVISTDPDDDRVLECAVSSKADYIISGDSDLLKLKKFRKIKILSPAEFLMSRSDAD